MSDIGGFSRLVSAVFSYCQDAELVTPISSLKRVFDNNLQIG